MDILYERFRKYEVKADNLKDFCERYHRPGKITDFNKDDDYNSHLNDIIKYGYTIIPASTSTTGQVVSYYGKA